MRATIFSHERIIGNVELRIGDASMGHVFGQFIPNENYYKNIQKYVRDFWKTNKPNYEKWDSLRFNAQLENDFFLFPQGGYTFDDTGDYPNEPIQIDISCIDISLLSYSTDTLIEPWVTVDIKEKLLLKTS